MWILREAFKVFIVLYFLISFIGVMLVAFWWLLPIHIQTQLHFPLVAGGWLVLIYASVFNHLPTQGRLLLRQNRFRYIHAPALFIATTGFFLGFVLN
jgi:hypothetical protein